jgi:hypothetical protein
MSINDLPADSLSSDMKKGVMKLEKRLDQHLGRILEIRKGVAVKNSSLVTDELTKHIPALRWHVKRKVANLRSELKEILWELAVDHEKRRFEPLRKDFEKVNGVSKRHLERGYAILESEQQMFISYHSVFFACRACSEVNKAILSRIENERLKEKMDGKELELLLKNAIIVFEVTSLIIEMIEQFQLKGLKEFQALRDTVFKELAEAETNSQRNVIQANHPSIPPHQKEDTLLRDRNLKESANLVRLQWRRFEDQIYRMRQNTGALSERLPSLALTRDNAKVQLDFLELLAVTQMMNQNIQVIDGLANLELDLAPLNPYDVCRLIGLETAALASSYPIS